MMAIDLRRYWFAEPIFDFELKQYEFLAFMQDFRSGYQLNQINPWLSKFYQLNSDIQSFIHRKKTEDIVRKKELKGVDLKNKSLIFRWQDDMPELKEVNSLIEFITPSISDSLHELTTLKSRVQQHIFCEPLGLFSANPKSGFILLNHLSGLYAYTYFKNVVYHQKSVSMTFVDHYDINGSLKLPEIKKELHASYPNHSLLTWYVTGGEHFPVIETLQPIVSEIIYELV